MIEGNGTKNANVVESRAVSLHVGFARVLHVLCSTTLVFLHPFVVLTHIIPFNVQGRGMILPERRRMTDEPTELIVEKKGNVTISCILPTRPKTQTRGDTHFDMSVNPPQKHARTTEKGFVNVGQGGTGIVAMANGSPDTCRGAQTSPAFVYHLHISSNSLCGPPNYREPRRTAEQGS